jgi:NAD-dependent dihydropyrimidine dehydrogenase PreA subunit
MPFIIASPCIDIMDKSCMEECPVDCVYEGDRKMYIQPKECIDCGACEAVCPVEAITVDRRTPAEESQHTLDNLRFFEMTLPGRAGPLGAPGGAQKLGRVGVDTPLVSAFGTRQS